MAAAGGTAGFAGGFYLLRSPYVGLGHLDVVPGAGDRAFVSFGESFIQFRVLYNRFEADTLLYTASVRRLPLRAKFACVEQ